jgi:hypothetical protein
MAIEWMENFSLYGTGATATNLMLNGLYASTTNEAGSNPQGGSLNTVVTDPDPNATGSIVFRMGTTLNNVGTGTTTSFTNLLRKVLNTPKTAVGAGVRLWFNTLPSSVVDTCCGIFQFKDNNNNIIFNVEVTPTGRIQCWRGTITESSGASSNVNRATIIAETVGPVIVTNAWQHVEIKATFDSINGAIEIRVDGVTVINASNINTSASNAPCAAIAFHNFRRGTGGLGPPVWHIKDFIIWDTTGTYNNNFLGSVSIVKLVPDGDVALNWAPSTGSTGWNLLDNSPPLDATQYISADNAPPDAYVCSLTNLPPDITSVRGVMSIHRSRKIDGGDGNIQVSVVSGTDEQAGADRPITPAFTYWFDIFEEDPATSAPWTPTAVDAMNLKIDRTV